MRILRANIDEIELISARRASFRLASFRNRTDRIRDCSACGPATRQSTICDWWRGEFLSEDDDAQTAAVCVLGQTAKVSLLGYISAAGKYVKVNDVWLRVVGCLRSS